MQVINVIKYKVHSYDFVLLALNLSELGEGHYYENQNVENQPK
jgi:hypothetical protein